MLERVPSHGEFNTARPVRQQLIVAKTVEEVEALRDIWEATGTTEVDSQLDYFLTVVRYADQVIRPHVVCLKREGLPSLMAITRLENLPVPFRLGYRTLWRPRLRALVATFGGILGAENRADEKLILSHLFQSLDRGDADLLLMRNVDSHGTLHRAALVAVPWMRKAHHLPKSVHWTSNIPESLDIFLEGRSNKTRATWRKQDRLLTEKYGDAVRIRHFREPSEAEELFRDIETVASKSYQRRLGVGFMNTPMNRALIELGLRKGWHHCWMLYIGDRPISFWNGTAYAGTFFIGTPGFDPDFGKDSVGRITMFRMLQDICADPAIFCLDYGQGDAEYKSSFGHRTRTEQEILIAAPRPWPVCVVMAASALSYINIKAKHFLEKSDWGQRLKASWRRGKSRASTVS